MSVQWDGLVLIQITVDAPFFSRLSGLTEVYLRASQGIGLVLSLSSGVPHLLL